MIKDAIKAGAKAFLLANWHILLGLAVLLGLIWFMITQIQSCQSNREAQKTANIKTNIAVGKGEVKVIEEQRDAINAEIKVVDSNANAAAGNFNAIKQADSSSRDSSWSNAKREFCKDHPADTRCQQ